ncbi:hypothetical protein XENORESO_015669 [Xenotaenia resolanae]|uniref:Uncharacterized protein n=1 Tax=Xenotaenia resolanae TaxID=208358 RepID=A0ABV0XAH6_9TELE
MCGNHVCGFQQTGADFLNSICEEPSDLSATVGVLLKICINKECMLLTLFPESIRKPKRKLKHQKTLKKNIVDVSLQKNGHYPCLCNLFLTEFKNSFLLNAIK